MIAPEHPGFGSYGRSKLARSVRCDLAYFYLDLIEKLKLDRIHLMGTSLGGWIAAELAVRNTSRLASLTLLDRDRRRTALRSTILFRISAEGNARRFDFDPERARRRA